MANVRSTVNQQVQVGVESSHGNTAAANRLLDAFTWTFGPKVTTKQFKGTGRHYDSASATLTDYSGGKISGPWDYAQCVYPLSSLYGAATITAHAGTTTVYDWKWTPPLVGSYAAGAKTYTLQQGDALDAEQYAFGVFTSCGYSFTRKQEVQVSGDYFSQTMTEGATLTSSPTNVQQLPAVGAQFSMWLDPTSANIGVTQLLDPLKISFMPSDFYDPYWPVNRTNQSFTELVDKDKKQELKFTLQANSTGIAIKGNYLAIGARAYVRIQGVGQLIENDQTVGVGAASGGNFTLTYKGQTTGNIAYNALASVVQTALRGLTTIGSTGCSVSGTAPTWTVLMTGALANDTTAITINGGGLTGGTPTVTAAPFYAGMTHDMVVFVSNVSELSDVDGVYAVEYTCQVAEDTAWNSGQAQVITLTNNLAGY